MTFNPEENPLPAIEDIQKQVQQALDEDLGTTSGQPHAGKDVSALLIDEKQQATAELLCREEAVLCGQAWFNATFELLDKTIQLNWLKNDGERIKVNEVICKITGPARQILTAERTALNFLQTLSATASITARFTEKIQHTHCRILDTRKTIPGLRLAQKYAVACGGGVNHRIGLYDMVLIKENHIQAAGSIQQAVATARLKFPGLKIEVEVETLDELEQAITAQVDRILLDNMDITTLKKAVAITAGQIDLEASGNIDLQTIASIAETGVDYISTGAITKHIQAIDFSLRFK